LDERAAAAKVGREAEIVDAVERPFDDGPNTPQQPGIGRRRGDVVREIAAVEMQDAAHSQDIG
jgi:hypothetical protein